MASPIGILLIVIQRKYKSGNKWSTGAHWNAYLSISPGNLPDGNVRKEWHSAQVHVTRGKENVTL